MNSKCEKCGREIELSERAEKLKEEEPSRAFFCQACRERMVNERIAQKMNWVHKAGS